MKTEKYLKLIYERGSVIFRKVTSYNICEKTQLMTVTFENKECAVVDLVFFNCAMGKLVQIKENITKKRA